MNLSRYDKRATRVAAKYNNPRLATSVWASELNIKPERFNGMTSPVSWPQLKREMNERQK